MDYSTRVDMKERYFRTIKTLGYKVMCDLDPELNNEIYDIFALLSKTDKDAEINKKKYIFAAIGKSSPLSFKEFKTYLPGNSKEKLYDEFIRGVQNRFALEYTIDDVAAILLHEGYHLENFYKFVQEKPRLVLTREMIHTIVDEGNKKGSPLENRDMRLRMMKAKERLK